MLIYGLFMARLNSEKEPIDLYNVEKFIPTSFELIRELVSFLKELDKPEYSETRWIVEEVLTVLNTMDSKAIHEVLSFNRKAKSERSGYVVPPSGGSLSSITGCQTEQKEYVVPPSGGSLSSITGCQTEQKKYVVPPLGGSLSSITGCQDEQNRINAVLHTVATDASSVEQTVATDASSVEQDNQNNTFEANVSTHKDPYIYFYEDFLAAYDKKLRKAKGVYYTPLPVVNFIVRAINDVLKDTFNIPEGLADHKRVTVLDFACGTGTFILEIVRQILENSPASKRDLLIKEHILKNIYGFEYMIAPYTVAHLKLSQYLKDKGYAMSDHERFNVFLTNTLEHITSQKDMLLPALSKESSSAMQVKDKPILVITGNPPYSYVSKNNGEFISKLIKDYYFVDGKPLGERNSKGLQDDYVKFIRFAQWKIEKVEEGIVAIISNHAFIDNPTFRGMRYSLMQTFNLIYILDLHGNSQKSEKTESGSKDENVFDIKQGVAISIFVKTKSTEKKIYIANLTGLRDKKYQWLYNEHKRDIWKEIEVYPPLYTFSYLDKLTHNDYYKYIKITDIYNVGGTGIVTKRDSLTIRENTDSVLQTLKDLLSIPESEFRQKYDLPDDVRDWRYDWAKRDIVEAGISPDKVTDILYRPFDKKKMYYTGKSRGFVGWPVNNIMQHMLNENIGLVTVRQVAEGIFNHVNVSNSIIESRITLSNKGIAYFYPLYLYEEIDFLGTKHLEKKPNIKAEIFEMLKEMYAGQASSHNSSKPQPVIPSQEGIPAILEKEKSVDSCLRRNDEHGMSRNDNEKSVDSCLRRNDEEKSVSFGKLRMTYLRRNDEEKSVSFDKLRMTCLRRNDDVRQVQVENVEQHADAAQTETTSNARTESYATSEITPEQIMSYIYAVLHSPTYRTKYADFLKTDFPRIPFTDDYKLFAELAAIGWDLIQAHLQKKAEVNTLYKGMGDFAVQGSNTVDKVLYTEAQQRLYINAEQYFENIPDNVYNFYIGGYQVMHKYLKDRKGRTLTLDEINNVEQIAKTLAYTIDKMQEIDALTKAWI